MEAVIVFVPTANRSSVPIHAPRVGCDLFLYILTNSSLGFNSRTPCGVRLWLWCAHVMVSSFNSRTPCGVRHSNSIITIHIQLFQFTHPVWGATYLVHGASVVTDVSIHAPRVGCDLCGRYYALHSRCFNSRTPCGVRLGVDGARKLLTIVSIHAPRVGCDGCSCARCAFAYVSIHAPRVGCDSNINQWNKIIISFNSRTPCGVRHGIVHCICRIKCFNSRTPCGVRLGAASGPFKMGIVSIHAPRVGCDSS